MEFLIFGTLFCISSIIVLWYKTWKKVDRIREEIEKDFYNI